jgi:hypothetical protein
LAPNALPLQARLVVGTPEIKKGRHCQGGHVRHNQLHVPNPVEGEASRVARYATLAYIQAASNRWRCGLFRLFRRFPSTEQQIEDAVEPCCPQPRAIQDALARLGMQANPKQVVAALAEFGIDVTETLARQVKVGMLKRVAQAERQQVKASTAERPKVRHPRKVPSRRSFHA